jgi:hypothetical protein
VVLEKVAYLFSLNLSEEVYHEPKLLKKFKTISNPKGIAALCSDKVANIVILPGEAEHTVQVYDSLRDEPVEIFDVEEEISVLEANINGGVFAHTDKNGSKIKLRYINNGELIQVYNRGKDHVEVTSIIFNELCMRMAVASKKQTVHVFALPKELSKFAIERVASRQSIISDYIDPEAANKNSSLLESRYGATPGYFGKLFHGEGEQSYLKVHINFPDKSIAIYKKNLVIARTDGIVQYVDIQAEGKLYDTDEEAVKIVKLF